MNKIIFYIYIEKLFYSYIIHITYMNIVHIYYKLLNMSTLLENCSIIIINNKIITIY